MKREDFEELCYTCLIIIEACIEKWGIPATEMSDLIRKYDLCRYIIDDEIRFQSRGVQDCVSLIEDYIKEMQNDKTKCDKNLYVQTKD